MLEPPPGQGQVARSGTGLFRTRDPRSKARCHRRSRARRNGAIPPRPADPRPRPPRRLAGGLRSSSGLRC